jgi:thioredoxin 1
MKLSIRYMVFILLSFVLVTGCNSQKNEGSKKDLQSETIQSDSTGDHTQEKLNPKKPLVTFIELGSVKCMPCKMMQPIMDEIEKEYAGQVDVIFYDVWTDAGQPFAQQYKISAIPTQIFLDSNKNEYFRHTGFFPKEEIIKILKQKGVD